MKKTEEQKTEEQRKRLLAIRDAIVALWLRGPGMQGPDVSEIAQYLNAPESQVRATLRASSRYDNIDGSAVPGCKTHEHGSYGGRGNGSYPARWTPTIDLLRALLRGEDQHEHEWTVHVDVVTMKRAYHFSPRATYKVVAFTEDAARAEARRLATLQFGELHSNTSYRIEWRGRHFPGSKDEIEASVARHEAAARGAS